MRKCVFIYKPVVLLAKVQSPIDGIDLISRDVREAGTRKWPNMHFENFEMMSFLCTDLVPRSKIKYA